MDRSLSGSSICGIFQARVLEWIAISFSRGSSWPRNRARVSRIAGRRVTVWATREAFLVRNRAMTESSGRCPFREGGQQRFISWDDIWAEARPRNKKRQECRHEWGPFQAELRQSQGPKRRMLMRVKTEAAHGLELRGSGESGWRKVGTFLWGIFYLKKAN